jgi:hypothetical protein
VSDGARGGAAPPGFVWARAAPGGRTEYFDFSPLLLKQAPCPPPAPGLRRTGRSTRTRAGKGKVMLVPAALESA